MKLLLVGIVNDGMNRGSDDRRDQNDRKHCCPQERWLGGRRDHPFAKNSEISCEEMAPSRSMRQRASSSVRSTMVEAISRGEAPPSTIIGIRTPSCSLTSSALVHSDSPLRLAEVAVIGIPAAVTTAIGIAAFGTRSATFPVFAVTFSGNLDAAFTIIVNGPGQNFAASAWNSSGSGLANSS